MPDDFTRQWGTPGSQWVNFLQSRTSLANLRSGSNLTKMRWNFYLSWINEAIDLFGLYILFSQYRSCDNTQEVWSFVLFIKMRACKHEYACMHSFQWTKQRTKPPEYYHMICIGQTKCTSQKGLLQIIDIHTIVLQLYKVTLSGELKALNTVLWKLRCRCIHISSSVTINFRQGWNALNSTSK